MTHDLRSRRPDTTAPAPARPEGAKAGLGAHLHLTGISRRFGHALALDGVELAVERGSTLAVVGPSGSGKTTLLRIIAGFDAPDRGTVRLGGRVLTGGGRMVPPHRRGIGFVAQEGALFPHLSVGDNIAFGLDRRSHRGAEKTRRVRELLEMVSLTGEHAARRPDQLSGGQQQRVALARALAREPELMLLDEPFSALDAGLRQATRKAVAETLARAGVTTILVTHDQAEALSFASRVAVMREGGLAQVGSPLEVYTRPTDLRTAQFLGESVILDAELRGGLATCALGDVPVRNPPGRGAIKLMLRPEQIRMSEGEGIHGTVVDTDFFGPESTIRIQLEPRPGHPGESQTVNIRHWNAGLSRIGERVCLKVVGEGVAFLP